MAGPEPIILQKWHSTRLAMRRLGMMQTESSYQSTHVPLGSLAAAGRHIMTPATQR